MPPAQAISIGDQHFRTKSEARAFLSEILNRYVPGDVIEAEDGRTVAAALSRHPDRTEKTGCGVSHFGVQAAEYGTQCFCVYRLDGSVDRFSISACL